MREIPLTKGKVALVDDNVFDWVNQFNWAAWKHPKSGKWYARTTQTIKGKCQVILMHRFVCFSESGVDHKSGDTLDNRDCNLRPANQSQNIANSKLASTNTTGYKGVCRSYGKWLAYIGFGKDREYLKRHDTPEQAARAYDEAAIARWGDFARTNARMGLLPCL